MWKFQLKANILTVKQHERENEFLLPGVNEVNPAHKGSGSILVVDDDLLGRQDRA